MPTFTVGLARTCLVKVEAKIYKMLCALQSRLWISKIDQLM